MRLMTGSAGDLSSIEGTAEIRQNTYAESLSFHPRLEQAEQHAPAAIHPFEQLDRVSPHPLKVAMLELDNRHAIAFLKAHFDGRFEIGVVLEFAGQLPG